MAGLNGVKLRGCWSAGEVAGYLDTVRIPLRLGAQDSAGSPWVVSLWFLHEEGALWCAMKQGSKLAGYLRSQPQCGFEIAADAPPYKGVRGKGIASLVPERGEEILRRLLQRYGIHADSGLARSLLAKVDEEVAVRITPSRLTSWDFTVRMQGAVAPG